MALTDKLSAIGNAIRNKTGKTELLTLDQMSEEIASITTGGGSNDFPQITINNSLSYFDYNGNWDDVIETYGKDKITTQDLSACDSAFQNSNLKEVPFDINLSSESTTQISFQSCFAGSSIEKVNINWNQNNQTFNFRSLFQQCSGAEKLVPQFFKNFNFDLLHTANYLVGNNFSYMFYYNTTLKQLPEGFLKKLYGYFSNANSTILSQGFYNCYCLQSIEELYPPNIKLTSGVMSQIIYDCQNLKDFTFALQDDGTPFKRTWSKQVLNFSEASTYGSKIGYGTYQSSHQDPSKKVTDAESYELLKDDPNWWTTKQEYSRYNHDSAVRTINSLPDCSAGTSANTINFLGADGSATDGGAINTLTEEEIAVAAAKNWTIALK